MKEVFSQTYLQNNIKQNLSANYSIEIDIDEMNANLNNNSLFKLAARKNINRGFLFVSTVLGKHIPVSPNIALLIARLLAIKYYELETKVQNSESEEIFRIIKDYTELDFLEKMFDESIIYDEYIAINKRAKKINEKLSKSSLELKEKTLFIGFAETATGLGHSVYECFGGDIAYIHTTRELLDGFENVLDFQEEHCHATDHFLYAKISEFDKIILIDDELTTGKTALNFIKEINKKTGVEKFSLLSLLDWRLDEHFENIDLFTKENTITIDSVSLLKGKIKTNGDINDIKNSYGENKTFVSDENSEKLINRISFDKNELKYKKAFNKIINKSVDYLEDTGRFLSYKKDNTINETIISVSNELKKIIGTDDFRNKKIAFIGTEEFIYIPMKIAANFENAVYQSTTRSPIYVKDASNYGIKTVIHYLNPYDKQTDNFLYNIKDNFYDCLVLFFEKNVEEKNIKELLGQIKAKGINEIYIVEFEKNEIIGVEYINGQ